MKKKSLLSFLLAFAVVVTVFATPATAAPGDKEEPLVDTADTEQFPTYPAKGSVKVGKSAQWMDKLEDGFTYAKVGLDVQTVPKAQGKDIVVVLDRSASMSFQRNQGCLVDNHYTTKTFKQKVKYYGYKDKSNLQAYVLLESEITMKLTYHKSDKQGEKPKLVEGTVSGFATEHGGEKILTFSAQPAATANDLCTYHGNGVGFLSDSNMCKILVENSNFSKETVTVNGVTTNLPATVEGYAQNIKYSVDEGCKHRLQVAKEAANEFSDTLLAPYEYKDHNGKTVTAASENRIAMLTFDDKTPSKVNNGKWHTAADAAQLKNGIDNITLGQGTSYVEAMKALEEVINSRPASEKNRPLEVLFVSDGYPAHDDDEQLLFKTISDTMAKTTACYAVGIAVEGEETRALLKKVTKAPGFAMYVKDDVHNIKQTFKDIAGKMKAAATDATVTDKVNADFEIVQNDPKFPITLKYDGKVISTDAVKDKYISIVNNTITWKMNLVPSNASLSYYLKVKDSADGKDKLTTSDNTEILYNNVQDNWCKQIFPKNELSNLKPKAPNEIKITVEHYYTINGKNQTKKYSHEEIVKVGQAIQFAPWHKTTVENEKQTYEVAGYTVVPKSGKAINIDKQKADYTFAAGQEYTVKIYYNKNAAETTGTDRVKTGDNAQILLYGFLLVAAVGSILVIEVKRKKNKKSAKR